MRTRSHIAVAAAFVLCAAAARAEESPIKLGQIEDSSGDFAAAGLPKVHGVALAVSEINAKGGLLGRKIVVTYYDSQSDNRRYQEFARRAIQQDKVDVLFAGFTSASREAVRPIVDRFKQLYFYTNEYEGGLCDKNTFVTGAVPEQILSPFLPWMIDKFGKRVYTIAADYNFGQISAEWISRIVTEHHGEIIKQEFIPLAVSQFSQTISNIQAAKPDVLVTLMIGAPQSSFFEQAAAAKLTVPMASFVNGPVFYEHKVFQPPVFDNMYIAANYMEELDTPANHAFVKRWRAMFPDEKYINQVGEDAYMGVLIYAKAVEMAKSTSKDAVTAALETGTVCVDAPEGHVCVDAKSHHVTHSISLMAVQPDHSVKQLKVWPDVQPYWLGQAGCDLPKHADYSQYTPSNPPAHK
jgi:branched-chain amino acid transport system substrate-binding protein